MPLNFLFSSLPVPVPIYHYPPSALPLPLLITFELHLFFVEHQPRLLFCVSTEDIGGFFFSKES